MTHSSHSHSIYLQDNSQSLLVLAKFEASPRFYCISQLFSQNLLVFELWEFQEVHASAGRREAFLRASILDTEGRIQLLGGERCPDQGILAYKLGAVLTWHSIYSLVLFLMCAEKLKILTCNRCKTIFKGEAHSINT